MSTDGQTLQEKYYIWLSTQLSASQVSEIKECFSELDDYCFEKGIISSHVFDSFNSDTITILRRTATRDDNFHSLHPNKLSSLFMTAVWYYSEFISYLHETGNGENDAETEKIDHIDNEPTDTVVSAAANESDIHDTETDNNESSFVPELKAFTGNIIQFLKDNNADYIDKRDKNGALWIIGGEELRQIISVCENKGYHFRYMSGGSRYTNWKPCWCHNPLVDKRTSQSASGSEDNSLIKATPEHSLKLEPELLKLLAGDEYALLRDKLVELKILTVKHLMSENLWALMNRYSLYNISHRQKIFREITERLNSVAENENDNSYSLKALGKSYNGSSPARAFAKFCEEIAQKYPLTFRSFLDQRYSKIGPVVIHRKPTENYTIKISNPTGYINEKITSLAAVTYGKWILTNCGEHDQAVEITELKSEQENVSLPESKPEAKPEHVPEPKPEPEPCPEPKSESKPESKHEPEPELIPEPITKPNPDPETTSFFLADVNTEATIPGAEDKSGDTETHKTASDAEIEKYTYIFTDKFGSYGGNTPREALIAYINSTFERLNITPREKLIPAREITKISAIRYAQYICRKFSVKSVPVLSVRKGAAVSPSVSHPEKQTENASAAVPFHHEFSAQADHTIPASLRNDGLISRLEQAVLSADLDGITAEELASKLRITIVAVKRNIQHSEKIVPINGKLIHTDAFVDWEQGADQLESILDKLMSRNSGYVGDDQLYEYARSEMEMFLNDNDMDDSHKVFDMAQHLFGTVGYHGKRYSFQKGKHISPDDKPVSSVFDVIVNYAREQGGVFAENDLVSYLELVGLNTGNLRSIMQIYSKPVFLFYEPGTTYITAESMGINDKWLDDVKQTLGKLFADVGDHIVLRDIQPGWYSLLPALPGGRNWTSLLLQSVLRFYSGRLKARTICALDTQVGETLHAMLVSDNSEIQSFADAVAAVFYDDKLESRRYEAEELRRILVRRSMIEGNELIYNMPRALSGDERFAWEADGEHVTVKV